MRCLLGPVAGCFLAPVVIDAQIVGDPVEQGPWRLYLQLTLCLQGLQHLLIAALRDVLGIAAAPQLARQKTVQFAVAGQCIDNGGSRRGHGGERFEMD